MKHNIFKSAESKNNGLHLFVLCFLLFIPTLLFSATKGNIIKLYYTGSLNGNIDGCLCVGHPKAGLVKSAAYIKSLSGKNDSLLLDTGDLLDAMPDELMADEIIAAYHDLAYDAIAIGETDFANGLEALVKSAKTIPLISQNISQLNDDSKAGFSGNAPKIFKKGNIQIGVFALTDPAVLGKSAEKTKLKITSEEIAAQDIVKQFKSKNINLIILLYHGTYDNLSRLLAKVHGIHVAILGHEQKQIAAGKSSDVIVVSSGENGNNIGCLELSLSKEGPFSFTNYYRAFSYKADPDEPSIRERINSYEDKMIQKLKSGDTK